VIAIDNVPRVIALWGHNDSLFYTVVAGNEYPYAEKACHKQ